MGTSRENRQLKRAVERAIEKRDSPRSKLISFLGGAAAFIAQLVITALPLLFKFALLVVFAGFCVWLIALWTSEWQKSLLKWLTRICGGLAILLFSFYQGYDHYKKEAKVIPAPEIKQEVVELSLTDFFLKEDFSYTFRNSRDYDIVDTKGPTAGSRHTVKVQLYFDFMGKAKFIGFYLPMQSLTPSNEHGESPSDFVDDMIALGKAHKSILREMEQKLTIEAGWQGDEPMDSKKLVFTGQVLLYYEGLLSQSQKTIIINAYKKLGLNPQFRGLDYLSSQNSAREARTKK